MTMTTKNQIEQAAYLHFTSPPDLANFLAVVFSFLSTFAVMLIVWQAVLLLYRVPRQAHWQKRLLLVILSGSTYVVMYLMDVKSVISLVTSSVGGDIPLTSTLRTAAIAVLLLVLARITNSATRAPVVKK